MSWFRRPGHPFRRPGGLGDPFAVLGLPRRADLSDDEVRAAWRRIASASHPDRGDGGDPAGFAAAAAAYTALRTPFGRGEALADRAAGIAGADGARLESPVTHGSSRPGDGAGARLAARVWRGRPARLTLRVLAAAAAGALAVLAVGGWQPGSVGLVTGAATWLACTARRDLAPRR